MIVRKIQKNELGLVVEVHKLAFKDFFLTSLGDSFIKIYYNSVRIDKKGILIGYFENDKLCGFCAATTHSKGFNSHLIKKNCIKFGLVGLRLLFTKIPSLYRLINNLTKKNHSFDNKEEYAEILSIGVSEINQGKGIGKKLLQQVEILLKAKGINKLSLTTDYYNNKKAIQFYKGLGYDIYYDFITYPKRRMYRMIKKIN